MLGSMRGRPNDEDCDGKKIVKSKKTAIVDMQSMAHVLVVLEKEIALILSLSSFSTQQQFFAEQEISKLGFSGLQASL